MELFRRFPKYNPLPTQEQHIIPPEERSKYPAFAEDFETLERELMPYFRELDNEALRRQNSYRLMYVILIFGSTLATIVGIIQIAFMNIPWIGIVGAIVAAILGAVTSLSSRFNNHEHYLNARLAAERLRSAYFLFLGQLDPYSVKQERTQELIRYVADIKSKGERYESA